MAMSRLPTARRASPHTSVKGRARRGACLGTGVRELELQTASPPGGRDPVRSGSGAEAGANGCSDETAVSSVGSAVVGASSSVGSAVVGVSSSVMVVSSLVGSAAGLRRGCACGVQLLVGVLVGVLVGAAVGPGAVVRTSPPYPVPSGPATPSPRAMARLTQDS